MRNIGIDSKFEEGNNQPEVLSGHVCVLGVSFFPFSIILSTGVL
jgi:hypothetical protein